MAHISRVLFVRDVGNAVLDVPSFDELVGNPEFGNITTDLNTRRLRQMGGRFRFQNPKGPLVLSAGRPFCFKNGFAWLSPRGRELSLDAGSEKLRLD